jgi:hypothetical protein
VKAKELSGDYLGDYISIEHGQLIVFGYLAGVSHEHDTIESGTISDKDPVIEHINHRVEIEFISDSQNGTATATLVVPRDAEWRVVKVQL